MSMTQTLFAEKTILFSLTAWLTLRYPQGASTAWPRRRALLMREELLVLARYDTEGNVRWRFRRGLTTRTAMPGATGRAKRLCRIMRG
jgi:hypothetical protein